MKIAYIVHDLSKLKGHDKYTAELIKNLHSNHTVHVFSSSFKDIEIKDFIFHKIPVIRFPILLKILSFIIVSFPVIWLVQKREKFDIIHYQGACAVPIGPAVITAHVCSAELLEIYKNFTSFESYLKRIYHHIYTCITSALEKAFFKRSCVLKIISPSELAKRQLIQHYYILPKKIIKIYEGVNPEEFSRPTSDKLPSLRQKLNIIPSEFIILFIGDYIMKGLDIAIRSIKNLRCKLIILGRGDKHYYTNLALEGNVSDKLVFLGWQPEIAEYFALADAFLFPTLCDSFGLSVLEAMASGVPCMISKLAGISELLTDEKDAILLDYPFDYPQINEKLKRLINDDNFRKKISQEGKNLALEYTWERVAQETEALYEDLHTGKR